MPGWLSAFLMIAGGLFFLKMAYMASVALALPTTSGAIYVSTTRRRIAAALDALEWQPEWCVYDLGCGDGRVLRAVRRRCPVRAVGFELNPMAWMKAKLLSAGRGIVIKRRDFWGEPVADADVIFCYLFPDVMGRLAEKLCREAKPGAVVVSFNFTFPGMRPERVVRPQGSPVYIYRFPGGDREDEIEGKA